MQFAIPGWRTNVDRYTNEEAREEADADREACPLANISATVSVEGTELTELLVLSRPRLEHMDSEREDSDRASRLWVSNTSITA
jgi:hypothetical protein